MFHERSNITAPFGEHLKFQERQLLQENFGWIVVNYNKKTRIKILYILKLLYTGYSIQGAAPFTEHLKFQGKMILPTHWLWWKFAKQNKKLELGHYTL